MLGRSIAKGSGCAPPKCIIPRAHWEGRVFLGESQNFQRRLGFKSAAPARRLIPAFFAPQSLADLPLANILNADGFIAPAIEEDCEAFVFAIFDQSKTLQYVGFSKNLDSSLKTVFSRRPDKAYYYKVCQLKELNQKEMLEIREGWFEEVAGPPPGNKLALERAAWQQPALAHAINARAKAQAAEEKVKEMLEAIRLRGCKEEFMADPAKVAEGKVDFLPTAKMSKEELAEREAAREALLKASRTSTTIVNGEEEEFSVLFTDSYKTNGGHMFDILVTFESEDTTHRVIVGKDYYEEHGIEPEDVVMLAFEVLLAKNEPRQTEGLLDSSQFPVNYFSISELDQLYDDFAVQYNKKYGELHADKFWRFNRVHDYGPMHEDPDALAIALGGKYQEVPKQGNEAVEEGDVLELAND